jgi:UDPglucose 6-dehydrogenase
MSRNLPSTVDSEEGLFDISTAPTTPDGSLTFSPVLKAAQLQDVFGDAASTKEQEIKGISSLDAALCSSGVGVKNICCVGAGYVGKWPL